MDWPLWHTLLSCALIVLGIGIDALWTFALAGWRREPAKVLGQATGEW